MTTRRARVAALVLSAGFLAVFVWRSSRTSSDPIRVRFPLAGKHMQTIRKPLLNGDVLVLFDWGEVLWEVDVLEARTGRSRIQSLRLHGPLDSDISAWRVRRGERDWAFEGGGYAFNVHILDPKFGMRGKDYVTWVGGTCALDIRPCTSDLHMQ